MFRFFLAHQLSRTVEEVNCMTLMEYAGWQVYFELTMPQPGEARHGQQIT